MQLVMMITARCNAKCTHCSTSCGPERTEHLSRDAITRLIDEAADLSEGDTLQISITGGEPFLDLDHLKDILRYGSMRGAVMSCVTNGYWASSPEKARTILRNLKECGLALLAISTSKFHQQFIRPKRVDWALDAARTVGIECVLKFVRTSTDAGAAELRRRAAAAGATRTEVIPLMPTIRRDVLLPANEYVRKRLLPQGSCPGAIINIAESNRAYMCCTPGALTDFFSLGDISETSLKEIQGRFYLGAKQQLLRTHGPHFFANAVKEAGLSARLREAYTGVCDLCTHIAGDPEMAAAATKAAHVFAVHQLRDVLYNRNRSSPGVEP